MGNSATEYYKVLANLLSAKVPNMVFLMVWLWDGLYANWVFHCLDLICYNVYFGA